MKYADRIYNRLAPLRQNSQPRVDCADIAAEADARIAHLEGQRDVLVWMLQDALPILQDIIPTTILEERPLVRLLDSIPSALASIAAEKAQKGPT